jgi:hypothetical protein
MWALSTQRELDDLTKLFLLQKEEYKMVISLGPNAQTNPNGQIITSLSSSFRCYPREHTVVSITL